MMGNAVFQRRARELRERSGLTMEQLGEKLGGIKKSRINMWEFNGTVPREDVLIKLAQFYHVSTDYLLGNENLEGVQAHSKTAMILQRKLSYMSQADVEQLNNVTNALFPKLRELEEPEDDI